MTEIRLNAGLSLKTLVLLLVLLTGCDFDNEEKPEYLIPEEKRIILRDGDVIKYQSNTGSCDTFNVTLFKKFEEVCNTDFESMVWSEKCWIIENLSVYIIKSSTVDSLMSSNRSWSLSPFSLFHLNFHAIEYENLIYDPVFTYSISTFGNYFGATHCGLYENDSIGSISLNGVNYDVDILTIGESSETEIRTIYCSSKYGVIRYELENGNWWELQIE